MLIQRAQILEDLPIIHIRSQAFLKLCYGNSLEYLTITNNFEFEPKGLNSYWTAF